MLINTIFLTKPITTTASFTVIVTFLLASASAIADINIVEKQVIYSTKTALLNESLSKNAVEPLVATTKCLEDSVITADNLAQTRDNGPFSISSKVISRSSVKGFGGGTIYYPTYHPTYHPINASNCGLLAAIAVVPGFVSYESSIKWLGPRLASWGFVVITINTNSIYDNPDSRAQQLSAALDTIIADKTVGAVVDASRLGAIGWSMGGGGALKLAAQREEVRAIVPLAPYHDKDYGAVSTPTLVIACEYDGIASNKKYSSVFYEKAIGPKMRIEVNNASHFCPSYRFNERLLSKPIIAWMQRYINKDQRFDKFLCANNNYSDSRRISSYDYANCV